MCQLMCQFCLNKWYMCQKKLIVTLGYFARNYQVPVFSYKSDTIIDTSIIFTPSRDKRILGRN